jgi:hypothetical protein
MDLKLIVPILVIAAVPVCAQAQPPSVAKVTKGDAQKVLKIISGDKAKTQTYCDIAKLDDQIDEADEKKDTKRVDELYQKKNEMATKLGAEYVALMDGLQDVNPNSQNGQEIGSVLGSSTSCVRSSNRLAASSDGQVKARPTSRQTNVRFLKRTSRFMQS